MADGDGAAGDADAIARAVLIELRMQGGPRPASADGEAGVRRPVPRDVSFDRHELRLIMNLYGRMVAAGEWRDYAIDFGPQRAVFSVFRRTSEMPLYRIVKEPALARRQGAYAVTASGGLVMKRGQELDRVLRVLDRPLTVVV